MSEPLKCDVLVIGGGPGGYACAIRAGQLGLNTVLVEADRLGGTCLIRGCIPSKALIEASRQYDHATKAALSPTEIGLSLSTPMLDFGQTMAWKDGIVDKLSAGVSHLLKAANVHVVYGWAMFQNAKTCTVGQTRIDTKFTVLATGSKAIPLSGFKISNAGNGPIINSTQALSLVDIPKSMAIIGAGYIGVELGCAFAKLGCDIHFIEMADHILPEFEHDLSRPVRQWMDDNQVQIHTGARANSYENKNGSVTLNFETDTGAQSLACDKILVTIGRRPNLSRWGFENMGVDLDDTGHIVTDSQCHTSMRGVYAIGDLTSGPMLAHKATAQGEIVGEILAGQRSEFSPMAIPSICFSDPEIITIGMSKPECDEQGLETVTGKFHWRANGRALTLGSESEIGFIQITALKDTGRILGVQGVGRHISEISGECVLAIEMCATLEDLAGSIHAHPTLGEALCEAALSALGRPLHSPKL